MNTDNKQAEYYESVFEMKLNGSEVKIQKGLYACRAALLEGFNDETAGARRKRKLFLFLEKQLARQIENNLQW